MSKRLTWWMQAGLLGALCAGAMSAWALVPKHTTGPLDARAFFLPELYLSSSHVPLQEVLEQLPNKAAWRAQGLRDALGEDAHVFINPRSGAATNIMGAFPLIPGDGVGNQVTLQDLGRRVGRAVTSVDAQAVAEASHAFVYEHRAVLGIDVNQLGTVRAVQVTPELWHVNLPQIVGGVRVRDARVSLTISHGNVVTFGTEVWGNVTLRPTPSLTAEQALDAGFEYAGGRAFADALVAAPKLEILPIAPQEYQQGEAFAGPVGSGYRHRLVWTFAFQRPPEGATWEPIVDAHTGEVIAFRDKNQYITASYKGGVYPLTNTGQCPNNATCGAMQSNTPMPFANTGLPAPNNVTNSAGLFNFTGGTSALTLAGPFVRMTDTCGAANASSTTGDINLGGTNGQHDCTVGTGGGAGNTPASRSGFYELNKLIEQAKGWLPSNNWLNSQLTSNMNIPLTCNAYWDGSTVNFYRSGGGCGNTGEIAAIFDHEWGHGLDDNDSGGGYSNPSEGYADIAAIYRLQASCVAYGFDASGTGSCGLTADGTGPNTNEAQVGAAHCDTDCSGVRDADWAKHADKTPDTVQGFVCGSCIADIGPCGRQVHCAAAPVRQAGWDFVTRDLAGAPFNLDRQTAFLIGNKLFYQGSGNVGEWYGCTCGQPSSSCGTTNGYIQWLTADDDNGNLNDGTPHMTAIFNAFNRHGIACAAPTPVNSGCAGTPTAPTLTPEPQSNSFGLSWTAVPGASRYWVLRSEGYAGCDFGKAKIAEVTGTTYTDTQVANGRKYSYNVVAQGATTTCFSPTSNCAQGVPGTAPDYSVTCNPTDLVVQAPNSVTSTCTLESVTGFNSPVTLSCPTTTPGVSCAFTPTTVTPPANGTIATTLTLSADVTAPPGPQTVTVRAVSGAITRATTLTFTVVPPGGGIQTAVYDTALKAPACRTVGVSCDSGPTLVLGRSTRGPEPHYPNTINNSCADGTSGTFHKDESNDRLKVVTVSGANLAAGQLVRIQATPWVGLVSSDSLDLFYTANANSPNWIYLTTLKPTAKGQQTLSATYTLPTGSLQAVRAQFRFSGTATPCSSGSYNDRDDLIFGVQ